MRPRTPHETGPFGKSFVAQLRQAELAIVLDILRDHGVGAGCRIVEIGGGRGWQAEALTEAGYEVKSFDIAVGNSAFPVEKYDGYHLPCTDQSFDVAFSSNVLEHIPHVESFQAEIHRVLKPGGLAVHLMPTPTWRLAALLAHYPWLARALVSKLGYTGCDDVSIVNRAAVERSPWELVRRVFLAPRHGEVGNAISELSLFAPRRWLALFERTGWNLIEHRSNGLFYSGYNLLGSRFGMDLRRKLGKVIGGSCHLYVLIH